MGHELEQEFADNIYSSVPIGTNTGIEKKKRLFNFLVNNKGKFYTSKRLVTASIWEGFGRPVMEAETLGIPAVAYDVGAHKRYIKKGICVHLDINNMQKSEEDFKKAVLKVWNR